MSRVSKIQPQFFFLEEGPDRDSHWYWWTNCQRYGIKFTVGTLCRDNEYPSSAYERLSWMIESWLDLGHGMVRHVPDLAIASDCCPDQRGTAGWIVLEPDEA